MTALRTKPDTGTAHTPGPWGLDNNDVRDEAQSILSDATGCVVAEAYTLDRPGECEANARLIAAAPELLAALRPFAAAADIIPPDLPGETLLFAHFPSHFGGQTELRVRDLRVARAVIAKAEGRS